MCPVGYGMNQGQGQGLDLLSDLSWTSVTRLPFIRRNCLLHI